MRYSQGVVSKTEIKWNEKNQIKLFNGKIFPELFLSQRTVSNCAISSINI